MRRLRQRMSKVEVKSKLFEIIKGRRNGNGKKFMNL